MKEERYTAESGCLTVPCETKIKNLIKGEWGLLFKGEPRGLWVM